MTDNTPPPKGDETPARNSQRRIAPTNISPTPRSSRLQSSIPYPFQSSHEEENHNATDDDDEDHATKENTGSQGDRWLSRLSHSFFERRSDLEGSEELTRPVVQNTPSERLRNLQPPRIRSDGYFNLALVPGCNCYSPKLQRWMDVYELKWSVEDIEPVTGQGLMLKFEQEHPSLTSPATEVIMLPVKPLSERPRTYIQVSPDHLRRLDGDMFPATGLKVIFTGQDGKRIRGKLYRNHTLSRGTIIKGNGGDPFTMVPQDDMFDFEIETPPKSGGTSLATPSRDCRSDQAQYLPRRSNNLSMDIPWSRVEASERSTRENPGPSSPWPSNFSPLDYAREMFKQQGRQMITAIRLAVRRNNRRNSLISSLIEREEYPTNRSRSPALSAPGRLESTTQADIILRSLFDLEDSSSDNFESPMAGIEGCSPIKFDTPEGHARDSGFDEPSSQDGSASRGYDSFMPSTSGGSPPLELRRNSTSDADTSEAIPEDNAFLQSGGTEHPGRLTLSWQPLLVGRVDRRHPSEGNHLPPPRQPEFNVQQEDEDSDPRGLYNASPPRRRQATQEQQASQYRPDHQSQSAIEPVPGVLDPDETEEDSSLNSRSSSQENSASSSDEKSTSRGRSMEKEKRKGKKTKQKTKKRSRGRR